MRPLSAWIRELYRDQHRLPVMIVTDWIATLSEAKIAERAQIYDGLGRRLQLLNVEAQILGRQIPLL
jgi:hypothetical protein